MSKEAKALAKQRIVSFLRKLHWKELLALVFILVAIFFFRHQRHELLQLGESLHHTKLVWIALGTAVTVGYVFLQATLYVFSFLSVKGKLGWLHATELFLKRNFLSVFLPAGGISSLAYLPAGIRKAQVHKHEVHQASAIYGFIGIFSVFIVAIPVLFYLGIKNTSVPGASLGLVAIIAILVLAMAIVRTIKTKGRLYRWLIEGHPKIGSYINEVFSFDLSMEPFWKATITSVFIEVVGIVHLYIAMKAIGVHPSIEACVVGYIVATIFLIISPFLRGIGAIELSLTFILQQYGFTTLQALEITLLFRLFEFWLPLVAGILAFAAKGRQFFFRLLPPVLIFLLGIVNVFSVLTPPVASRMELLKEFIPVESIRASNFLVIIIGITLIITAHFLMRGLKIAWILALSLSVISCLGHLSKALDYEEAMLAFIVMVILLSTRKQYRLKSNPRLMNIGITTSLATFAAVLVFGSIGFYYIDERHFHVDFTWRQSIRYAFNTFVLIQNADLKPFTNFGYDFIFFINSLGCGAWGFFLYCIVRPQIFNADSLKASHEKAKFLLTQFGDSPLDHFKISNDKALYVSELYDGFVSYRMANGFAVVLEEPICAEENKAPLLKEFEEHCMNIGHKPIYYRVDEDSLYHFDHMKRKKVLIGQEAVLAVSQFKLEGKDRKALRNSLNSLEKKGYHVRLHNAPLPGDLVQVLEQVSNEWLEAYEMKEVVFSQGMFDRNEIKHHDVITLADSDRRIVAFLNIIPDYTPGECTYDLIRKARDAPGGAMDALIVELINYAKSKGYVFLNLGMVPMSGIDKPENPAEQVVKFAYERLKRFRNYQGLRDFKEKYATQWFNKYMLYQNDFDLMQLPAALNKVMQPLKESN